MARTGRPKAVLTLDDEERETLARWARRPLSPQSLALRSKIVLGCAEGKTQPGGGRRVGLLAGHGRQVAGPVRGQTAEGLGR